MRFFDRKKDCLDSAIDMAGIALKNQQSEDYCETYYIPTLRTIEKINTPTVDREKLARLLVLTSQLIKPKNTKEIAIQLVLNITDTHPTLFTSKQLKEQLKIATFAAVEKNNGDAIEIINKTARKLESLSPSVSTSDHNRLCIAPSSNGLSASDTSKDSITSQYNHIF